MVAHSTCLKCFANKSYYFVSKKLIITKNMAKRKLKLKILKKPFVLLQNKRTKATQPPMSVHLTRKTLANLNIPQDSLQVLLGTLLGDGSLKINKNYVNARFQMRHAIRYADWFYWKANKLSMFSSAKAIHIQQPSKGSYGKTPMLHFQTLTNKSLTKIHSIVTKKNILSIKRSWLNFLSPVALMCWWLDDGALTANWRQGVFCCEGFNKKQQKILAKYLNKVWKINARVVPHRITQKKKGVVVKSYLASRIKLSTTELKKLLKIIMPFVPCANMVYKVCLRYADSKLQQRWISEVKKALPQFVAEIDLFYSLA
jgi:hypothetical protein